MERSSTQAHNLKLQVVLLTALSSTTTTTTTTKNRIRACHDHINFLFRTEKRSGAIEAYNLTASSQEQRHGGTNGLL